MVETRRALSPVPTEPEPSGAPPEELSARHLRLIMDSLPVHVSYIGRDLRYRLVNRAYEETYGRTRDEIEGAHMTAVLGDETFVEALPDVHRVLGGEVVRFERRVTGSPLGTRYFMGNYVPDKTADGEIVGFLVLAQDVTETKLRDDALRASEHRYRGVFEASRDGITITRADGRIIEANKAYLEMIGRRAEDLGSLRYQDLTPPRWRAMEKEIIETQLYARGYTDEYEKEYRRSDGAIIQVAVRSVALSDEDPATGLHIAVVRDISEAKRAKEDLEKSEALFRGIFEHTAIGVRVGDVNGKCLMTNPALRDMLGYGSDDLGQMHFTDHTYPEDRGVDSGRFRDMAAGRTNSYSFDKRFLRRDGSIFWGHLTVSRIGPPIPDRPFYVALVEDLTHRKESEEALRAAKEAAEAANETKSRFLANMSHELRTPLNAIIGFTEVMTNEVLGPMQNPKYAEYAEDIHQSGRHLLEVLGDILDLSKIESGKLELVDSETNVVNLIDGCRTLLSDTALRNGVILILDDRARPIVRADRVRLKQVIINVMSNAIKFTPRGGTVTIETAALDDGGIAITVTDTGVGMASEDIPRALEIFGQLDSDLSRRFEGTGLGLPIAKSLVEHHGGALAIESVVGEGTTVTITLPQSRVIAA